MKPQKPVEPLVPSTNPSCAKPESRTTPVRGRFERPRVRSLGALPAVTTAFGGSFTP